MEEILLKGPFYNNGGRCWFYPTPLPWSGDTAGNNDSVTYLYEDGNRLGPGHSAHADIRLNGAGRYSHWGDKLWFSTSDGSDPNLNGRTYVLRAERELRAKERADYAFSIVNTWIDRIGGRGSLSGKVVCELGPGYEMSTLAICAGLGADIYCVERFPPNYSESVHSPLFTEIASRLELDGYSKDTYRLRAAVAERSFAAAGIKMVPLFIEELPDSLSNQFEVCFSQAVLEHLENPEKAFAAMARIMAPGGYGFHQVDFRDHHDFTNPLEFLLEADAAFEESLTYRYSRGNRWRLHEYVALFERSGFEVVSAQPNMFAEPAYLDTLLERLSKTGNRYSALSREQLTPTSAFMIVRRRG